MTASALTTLALGWLAFAAAAISPGPNMVAVASRSLGAGRAAGQRVALGIALGACLWALLSAAGAGALFERFPGALRALSLLGGAYLCLLGARGLRSAWRGGTGAVAAAAGRSPAADVGHGLAVTMTNPKVALVWASLATFVAPATASLPMLGLFAGGTAALAYAIYGGYGWLFSSRGARALHERFARAADAVFGALFTALGLSLVSGAR